MPFLVIKGSLHLVGRTAAGAESGFQPDGDSMQSKPDNPSLLDKLERVDKPHRLISIGSTQLRFEGIDALELHFEWRGRASAARTTRTSRTTASRVRSRRGASDASALGAPDRLRPCAGACGLNEGVLVLLFGDPLEVAASRIADSDSLPSASDTASGMA